MATSRSDHMQAGVDDSEETNRRRLVARPDNSRRLPRGEDLNETTLTTLDGRTPTEAPRPHIGDQPVALPSVAKQSSADDPSNVPAAKTDEERSSMRSGGSQPPSGVVPARLPALDVRHSSEDDVQTKVEDDQQTAWRELGSVESITVEGGSRSRKLKHPDAAWMRSSEETNDVTAMVNTERRDGTPDDGSGPQEAESKRAEDSTSQLRHNEIDRSSDEAETGSKDTNVSPPKGDLTAPEDIETFEDLSSDTNVDGRSRNGARSRRKDGQEVTETPAGQQPGENDSGVNVEDTHDDEPDQPNDTVQQRTSEIPTVDVTPEDGDGSSRRPDDGVTSSPTRHLNARKQNGDADGLTVARSPRFDAERRRNSRFDVGQPLQQSDEGYESKYRLVILAQKGEWSVLDQILRAMDKSSYYEINLADEV